MMQRLRRGDVLPFCYGMDEAQRYWSFEDQAGAPVVLILAGGRSPAELADLLDAFAVRLGALAGVGMRVLAPACAPGWATAVPPTGIALTHVLDATLFEAAGPGPCAIVADRAMRLVVQLDADDPTAAVEAAVSAVAGLAAEPSREVSCPAPVLIRPGLFDTDLCARLIARFEGGAHKQGAMSSEDAQGGPIDRIDAAKKSRRDLALDPAEPLHAEILEALSSRLVPDIARAFQVQVAHLDRILVARYDDTGGWFRRHRDNSSAHLAWREFALSVNLNTGGYDGGELLFPEFNDHRHNPPAGAGMVFSASLLHEALPVTRGSRYVLLTFLHSDAAEARRQATRVATAGVTEPA